MEVKVPALAESISLARILHWHVQPGDKVERGSNLVDIETDKVTLEVPAPQDGVVADILCAEGTDVASGQVIASIEAADSGSGDSAMETPPPQAAPMEQSAAAATTDATSTMKTDPPQAGPAARALLQQHGLKAEDIPASGANGRLLPEDINAWLERGQQSQETVQSAPPELPSPSPAAQPAPPELPSPSPAAQPASPELPSPSPAAQPAPPATAGIHPATADNGERNQRREALSPLRQSIAKRLLKAQHESALLTTFNEIDMSAVMQLRKKHGESFRETHGVKLGYMSFFIRAAIAALRRFPAVGASIAANEIIYHDYYDISIAVGSPRGLVVPVIRAANKKSMADLEQAISDFGIRASEGSLTMDEMLGGTFTITNGGIFGSLLSTPIINPPQSAILGMHKIQKRAIVDDSDSIVARPMMYLALTYDHRIIDGREAVQFLVTVKEHIEDPLCLLLDA